ncbi:hypothetical protein J6590_104665 [Homalodisca vitripennis]|nr:hypothetical protein J6590_104665 [Homalodisca vitripennis]
MDINLEKVTVEKNGEKVWRCLGKTCGATVTTNPDITAVISCKPQQSGHHSVTMRSLASPKAGCTTPSAVAVVETKTSLASTTHPLGTRVRTMKLTRSSRASTSRRHTLPVHQVQRRRQSLLSIKAFQLSTPLNH